MAAEAAIPGDGTRHELCQARVVNVERVRPAADLFLRHRVLFFVPAIAAVVVFGPALADEWLAITAGLLGGTLASTAVAGWVCRRASGRVASATLLDPRPIQGR